MYSASSEALLRRLVGSEEPDEQTNRHLPQSMGPTLVQIADPKADAELVVELLDEASHGGRRRNRALQRRTRGGLGRDDLGRITYSGRLCCGELVIAINQNLSGIAIPSEYMCDCGAVYRVQNATREERRHAW